MDIHGMFFHQMGKQDDPKINNGTKIRADNLHIVPLKNLRFHGAKPPRTIHGSSLRGCGEPMRTHYHLVMTNIAMENHHFFYR